jgi:hypothetical protein
MARYTLPEANSDADSREILPSLLNAGARVTAWVVLMNNERLAKAHPGHVVRTAFGDPLTNSLCPAHPDVADYAVALCTDLAETYPVAALVIESGGFVPFQLGHFERATHLGSNDWLMGLMGICFCEHCLAKAAEAEVDGERLRRRVAADLAAFLDGGYRPSSEMSRAWWLTDVVSESDFHAYLRCRCRTVADLARRIRAAMPAAVRLGMLPTQRRPVCLGSVDGYDLRLLADAVDYLEMPFYLTGPEAIRCDAWDARRRLGSDASLSCVLRPTSPDLEDAASVALAIDNVRQIGYRDIAFYNFGRVQRRNLIWVASALGGQNA